MDALQAVQPQDLASGGSCCCCGDNTDNKSPPSISPDIVVEDNCCSGGEETKQGGCCSESNEDCCEGNEGSDVGDEKDGCDGCCGGVDSSPIAERRGCCDKEASKDEEVKLKDGSACACCVEVLVREAVPQNSSSFQTSSSQFNDAAESIISSNGSSSRTLRACCKILKKNCRISCSIAQGSVEKKAPAFPSYSDLSIEPDKNRPNQFYKGNMSGSTDLIKPTGGQEKLQLEVRGIDCVDCTPKIARALAQLPSVKGISIDWFSGIADLRYDPEIIAPLAIAAYVARATGFGVRPKTNASDNGATSTIKLPLLFATIPPPEDFYGFDTRVGSNPNIVEVSFSINQDSDRRPRDVLEDFKPFGVQLLPNGFRNEHDNATYDFIIIGLRTLGCTALSIPVLVIAWAKLPPQPVLYGAISIAFCTGIQVLAFSILSQALRSILYLREIDLSVLVAMTTLIAYLFSIIAYACEVAGMPFSAPFFETTALLITLIMLGRTIAAATRRSTRSALRELERLQPNDVLLVSAEKEAPPQPLDARLLYYGDIIRVLPESLIATDGLVIGGSSDVDESSVTGESVALAKQKGNRVIAGTLNLSGTLDIQVTRLVHENSLSHITTLVKQAQLSHSSAQDLADILSAWILPVSSFTACTAFVVWILVDLYVHNLSKTSSLVEALTYVIAVFVVSCPCAIGLAVPMVVASAIRVAVREGVLFRSPDALQTATDVTTLVFDKTGTLTQGTFTVEWAQILVEGAEYLIKSLVEHNKHPISQGVHRYLCANTFPTKNLTQENVLSNITTIPGKGIKASLRGFPFHGGKPTFTGTIEHPTVLELSSSGLSLFTVSLAGQPIAFFGLADTPRPDAGSLISELVRRGKKVVIMSGDTSSAVHRLADVVGVPSSNAFASYTPEDKNAAIVAMRAKGQRVCFVGDGTNDAPALSHADVSLAIAAGSDVALAAADAVLLGSDLKRGVLALLDIAAAARMHSWWALGWCVIYNVFAILLAAGAFVKVRIEPRWAGIGQIVSVVPVAVIGLLLDWRWKWVRQVARR